MANVYGKVEQSDSTGGTSSALRDASARTWFAQSFIPALSTKRTSCRFTFVAKTGSPVGNAWVELRGPGGGDPAAAALIDTSQNVDVSTITANQVVTFVFSTLPTLTAGQVYYLVLKADYTINGTAYWTISRSTTSTYSGGSGWIWNGSEWTAQTWDFKFAELDVTDGGNFDIDTSTANVSELTALKGGSAPSASDSIFVYNGATLTVDTGDNLACLLITLGDMSTGAAIAGQKYGVIQCNAGSTITFTGSATVANSGIKANPTTPGEDSKQCRVVINGTAASPSVFTNSAGAYNANNLYGFVLSYGGMSASGKYWEARYPGTPSGGNFISAATQNTVSAHYWGSPTIVTGAASASFSFVSFTNTPMNYSSFIDWFTVNADGVSSAITVTVVALASSSQYMADGVEVRWLGLKLIGPSSGSVRPLIASTCLARPNVGATAYGTTYRTGTAITWPTTTAPTGLAFTDPETNGELRFTITNAASYSSTDVIVIYNASGDVELARAPISSYNTLGYGIVTGLANDTLYTMYAKATSDNNTYSAASSTATGTPTSAANPFSISSVTQSGTRFTIACVAAGASQGSGYVRIGGVLLSVVSWSATSIVADLRTFLAAGTYALVVVLSSGYTAGTSITVASDVSGVPSGYSGALGYHRSRVLAGGFN